MKTLDFACCNENLIFQTKQNKKRKKNLKIKTKI